MAPVAKCLTVEKLNQLREKFYSDPKNVIAQNVCTQNNPWEMAASRRRQQMISHVYNVKIESEGKPITTQKVSGRCWLFAALNVMRIPFMKKYEIDEFEFSQAYLFYVDKIERCNFFLNNMVEVMRRGEPLEGRLTAHLLNDPINDGGQWDMFVNLVNKYGLIPKKHFQESYGCQESLRLNFLLKTKLREFAKELRAFVQSGASDEAIQKKIDEQIAVAHNILGICLGVPEEKFEYEFYSGKDKKYNKMGPCTPLEFYEKYVKPVFNIDEKVCLVNDPRPTSPYGRLFTLDCFGNVVGGRRTAYNNQPIDVLMKAVRTSIEAGEAVWFGCDVLKKFDRKHGLIDLQIHDLHVMLGTEFQVTLNKADRLLYGDSVMSHAMVFTAVGTNEKDEITKFRVENSWGDEIHEKGYIMMTADWFREFVFEIVVDKKFVPEEVMEVYKQEPILLPLWDPMGALAN